MSRFKEYRASAGAIAQGRALGLYGDTAKRLSRMARRSAPFTGELGNRRYEEFVLAVNGDQVEGVSRLEDELEAA
jgi:hypothetical protein